MNMRLAGDDRVGRDKNYLLDPLGAVRLQLKIAHAVSAIRAKLDEGTHPDETEIVPLDI